VQGSGALQQGDRAGAVGHVAQIDPVVGVDRLPHWLAADRGMDEIRHGRPSGGAARPPDRRDPQVDHLRPDGLSHDRRQQFGVVLHGRDRVDRQLPRPRVLAVGHLRHALVHPDGAGDAYPSANGPGPGGGRRVSAMHG